MKKSDLIFGATLVPLDFVMLCCAGIAAYAVRFSRLYIEYIREATVVVQFSEYISIVIGISIIWLVIFAVAGLYSLRTSRSMWDEIGKVFLACSTGILVVVIYIFLNRELFASRFIVLAAWIFAIFFISTARVFARSVQRYFLNRGKGVHGVIVIGDNKIAHRFIEEFTSRPGLGYVVRGVLPNFTEDKLNIFTEMMGRRDNSVDEILLADPTVNIEEKYRLLQVVNEYHLEFRYAADILGAAMTATSIETFAGIPIVEIKKTPLDGWGRIIKRVFDIVFSLLLLVVFSPVFLITACAIFVNTRGPLLYASRRVGGKAKEFKLLKFRSMVVNADRLKDALREKNERNDGPLFKINNDPRVTRVGKFIRRWSIDELPQLINALRGEVSLVGPRPHEPHEVAHYHMHHKRLLDIKPGITGLGQVSGRSDLSFEDEVKLDTYYIEHWSLWLDLKILLQTPRAIFGRRRAQ